MVPIPTKSVAVVSRTTVPSSTNPLSGGIERLDPIVIVLLPVSADMVTPVPASNVSVSSFSLASIVDPPTTIFLKIACSEPGSRLVELIVRS